MSFLDIAQRNGVLGDLSPSPIYMPNFSAPLFSGATPSDIEWKDGEAFKHFLTCLCHQATNATKSCFRDTVDNYVSSLELARKHHKKLEASGVMASQRSFGDAFDANQSAMVTFETARGHQLSFLWK